MQRIQRIFAIAQNDNAACHFAFTIQFGNAAPHLWPFSERSDILQQHGDAVTGGDDHVVKILRGLQVAGGTYHVLRFAQFQHRTAIFLIRRLNSTDDLLVGDALRPHTFWIDDDLILLDHAAHAGDFCHIRHRFQFIFQQPVLKAAQVGQTIFAATIHQRVLVDPANTSGVRPRAVLASAGRLDCT